MSKNFLELDPVSLWEETDEQVEKPEFVDSSVLESLQDVPYGQMLTQEEQKQVIQEGPQKVDFMSLSPSDLFGDIDESQVIAEPKQSRLDRFIKTAVNATIEPTLDLAEYAYQYGPMAPINMLKNVASGKPLFEEMGITETFTFDVAEAQTREEEIDDVAATSFGTIMSFVLPTGLMARGASALGVIPNKALPRLLAQNTPKAVLNVAGRPSLIGRLSPENQARLRSAYRSALRTPRVGAATKATVDYARRSDKALREFAEVRGQIIPNLLSDYVNTPAQAIAFEALAAATAAQGAAIAETIAPGSITARIYGEMAGGLGSAALAGPVARGAATVVSAAKSPRQTFQNVLNKFTGDEKSMLEVVSWLEDASRAKLREQGLDETPENLDRIKQEMISDIQNIDEDLKDLSLGIATGNDIILAFEAKLAQSSPDFAKDREKRVMAAYDAFYTYINSAMSKGSPNSINAAARLQKAAFDSAQEREVANAQSAALESANKLFKANSSSAEASARQYEINYNALLESRKIEDSLWRRSVKNLQPDTAEAYSTSLRAYNQVVGERLPDSEGLSIQKDFRRMRDSATYAEIKKQMPELEAMARDSSNEEAVALFETAKRRLRQLEDRYGYSRKKLDGLLKIGVPEETANLITGNSVQSISYRYKGPTFTVRDLHNVRSTSLALARRLRKSNPSAAKNYEDLSEALLRDLIKLNDNSKEYLTAVNYSRALNQRWNTGFSKTVLRGVDMGTLAPEATLERAFFSSNGLKTRLNFEALDRASVPLEIPEIMGIEGLVTSGASRGIQEDFLRNNLAKILTKDGKTIDTKKLEAFTRDQEFISLLKERPSGILNDLKDAGTAQAVVDDILRTNKITKDDLANAALHNFLGKTQADRVIKTMLVESDASENFASLMRELRHSSRYLANRYKSVLTESEIAQLERAQSAALEGIQNSLFRLAHDVATSGDSTSFEVMKKWLETPPYAGELAPVDLIRKNRVMSDAELDNFMTYVNKGVELQSRLASDDVMAILEATQDPITDLILRISGAKLGATVSQAMGGSSSGLIAQSAGSSFLRNAFSKMPISKLQDTMLRMLKDKEFFVEVLNSNANKDNPNKLYMSFRAFYLENGYLNLVNILDTVAENAGITEVTDPVIDDLKAQRLLQPSEMETLLPPATREMEQRGIMMRQPQARSLLQGSQEISLGQAREAINEIRPPVLSNVLSPEQPEEDRGSERYVVSDLKPEQKETVQQYRPLWDILEDQYGLPDNWLEVVAFIESSYDPQAIGITNADARGMFQFTPIALSDYPHDPFNPEQNSEAAARYASNNMRYLAEGLGRDPTAFEIYLAHQQGGSGALKLLTAPPDALAADVRTRSAVSGQNLDPDTTTVAQLINKFKDRYNAYAKEIS